MSVFHKKKERGQTKEQIRDRVRDIAELKTGSPSRPLGFVPKDEVVSDLQPLKF